MIDCVLVIAAGCGAWMTGMILIALAEDLEGTVMICKSVVETI
jgi:hypothetical protein